MNDEAQDYGALLAKYNKVVVDFSIASERKRILEVKVDMLLGQLDFAVKERDDARAWEVAVRDHNNRLSNAVSDLRAENARRRNENKGLQAQLDDAREEIQQRNEEIAELKRARLYSIPTTYIVGADPSDPVWSRMKLLEEENARLEADNAKLEACNEQISISLERGRQDLFNAQAKLTAVRNAVK